MGPRVADKRVGAIFIFCVFFGNVFSPSVTHNLMSQAELGDVKNTNCSILEFVVNGDVNGVKAWVLKNNPNLPILGRWTALHLAVVAGKIEICEILLESGSSVEGASNAPRSPLMLAAEMGLAEITKLLIREGANVDNVSEDGHTALSLASGCAVGDIHSLLRAKGNPNFITENGQSCLCRAVLWAPTNVLSLLDGGADPNQRTSDGTPLTLAMDRGSRNTVETLLDYGGDPTTKASNGSPLIFMAAKEGRTEALKRIISDGVDPLSQEAMFEGKLPHDTAVGETGIYIRQYIKSRQKRDKLLNVAQKGKSFVEDLDDADDAVFM